MICCPLMSSRQLETHSPQDVVGGTDSVEGKKGGVHSRTHQILWAYAEPPVSRHGYAEYVMRLEDDRSLPAIVSWVVAFMS